MEGLQPQKENIGNSPIKTENPFDFKKQQENKEKIFGRKAITLEDVNKQREKKEMVFGRKAITEEDLKKYEEKKKSSLINKILNFLR